MLSKTKLQMLLGAAALGAAGHALAATTNAGTGGTIWLTVDDVTTGSSYVFDTGLTVSSFTGTTGYSETLSSGNWTSFLATIDGDSLTSTDVLHYAVVGVTCPQAGSPPTCTPSGASPNLLDFTGTGAQSNVANTKAANAWAAANNFLTNRANPASSDSFEGAGSLASLGWYAGGYDSTFNSGVGNTDWSTPGTAMAFFQTQNTSTSGALTKGTYSTFAGTWDLSAAGVLTYTVPTVVPLPAPLLLLLSGLGLTGLVARRGKPGSDETRSGGAAAV